MATHPDAPTAGIAPAPTGHPVLVLARGHPCNTPVVLRVPVGWGP